MLGRDQSKNSPWYVVPADDKLNARLIVSRIVLDTVEGLKLAFPQSTPNVEANCNAAQEIGEMIAIYVPPACRRLRREYGGSFEAPRPQVRERFVGLLQGITRGLGDDADLGGQAKKIDAVLTGEIGDG